MMAEKMENYDMQMDLKILVHKEKFTSSCGNKFSIRHFPSITPIDYMTKLYSVKSSAVTCSTSNASQSLHIPSPTLKQGKVIN